MAREAIPGARQPVDAGPDTATATRPPISDPPHASWRPQRRYFRTLLGGLFHLAAAALAAILRRSSGVSFAALAFPPFRPPRRPRETAAGSFPASGSGSVGSPAVSPTMEAARRLRSAGRCVRERSGMTPSWARAAGAVNPTARLKLTHYPAPSFVAFFKSRRRPAAAGRASRANTRLNAATPP